MICRIFVVTTVVILSLIQPTVSHAGNGVTPHISYWVPLTGVESVLIAVRANPHQFSSVVYNQSARQYTIGVAPGHDIRDSTTDAMADTEHYRTLQPGRVEVTFRQTQFSLTYLSELMQTVGDYVDKSTEARAAITYWYVDEYANRVHIAVSEKGIAIGRMLEDRYGDAVRILHGERPTTAIQVSTLTSPNQLRPADRSQTLVAPYPSRALDRTPYSTANRIIGVVGNNIHVCSTAFKNYPSTYVYTAGHCFPTGTTIYQGYWDATDEAAYYTNIIGTVASQQWGNDRIDAGSIRLSAQWFGNDQHTGTNSLVYETDYYAGRSTFSTGSRFCANGAISGYRCEGQVVSVNVCANADAGNGNIIRVCGMTMGRSLAGNRLVSHGDSGGPVIDPSLAAGARVGGIIALANANGNEVYFTPHSAACAQTEPYTCN